MRQQFISDQRVAIDPGLPSQIQSQIQVAGLTGRIRDVNVAVDIDHTWTNDLRLTLIAPDGRTVRLAERVGGRGDNFRNTRFDDAAAQSIAGQLAPFTGSFRPLEPLAVLNDMAPEGLWTLRVEDRATEDGGSLNRWSLSIETGANVYEQRTPVAIDPRLPGVVRSYIDVAGLGALVVRKLRVTVDIRHTWVADLGISLIAPDGTSVRLVRHRGGRGDDFNQTTFDDAADTDVANGSAPFAGGFRPEQPLSELAGHLVDGTWTLRVEDSAPQDGGVLRGWMLEVDAMPATPRQESAFEIDVRFVGGLTPDQRSVFQLAAARWREIIVGALPEVLVDGEPTRGVRIFAEGRQIDDMGGILGQAGPTLVRSGSRLPARGVMQFDSADLAQMERDGTFVDVIIHEMGHVLGLGTLWPAMGLLQDSGTSNPTFVGTLSMQAYGTLVGAAQPTPVPVENQGGPGTREGHWRETTFDNELMTGYIDSGANPLSRLTIAALADMGYEVDEQAADQYAIPPAMLGFFSVASHRARRRCASAGPEFETLA